MTSRLDLSGFTGWFTFVDLARVPVPRDPGVYVVVRPTDDPPIFCAHAPYRGDLPFPVVELAARWVPGECVVYIGKADRGVKADGLHRRLRQFRRYGAGHSARHSGGRAVWQLADHADLLVGWRTTDEAEAPRDVETAMITAFRSHHGVRPFTNALD